MVWFIRKKGGAIEMPTNLQEGQALLNDTLPSLPAAPSAPVPIPDIKEKREAPLFIKVDRYKELLSYLRVLRSDTETLNQLGSVLNSTQEMLVETNKALGATLNRTNKLIDSIESELGRPQHIDIDEESDSKMAEMKISLTELRSQLDKLKSQVKAVSI